jgi:hypothetical protein
MNVTKHSEGYIDFSCGQKDYSERRKNEWFGCIQKIYLHKKEKNGLIERQHGMKWFCFGSNPTPSKG